FDNGATWQDVVGGQVTVPAGTTTFYVSVATTADEPNKVYEGPETFTLTAGTVRGTDAGVGTITDDGSAVPPPPVNPPTPPQPPVDDRPTVSISVDPASIDENDPGVMTFTITLSNASEFPTTVTYTLTGTATSGDDYTTTATGTVTIPAGQTSATFTVDPIVDGIFEPSETVIATITSATGHGQSLTVTQPTATGTIVNNDLAPPTLDLDASAAGTGYTTTYTENGSGVAIADSDSLIVDLDDANMASATIVLTNAKAGDVLSFGGLPAGISATVDTSVAGRITVSLTGSASKAAYETAIEAIRFSSTSETPDTTPRTVNVTVNDAVNNSNTATAVINVVSVNDPPVANNDTGAVNEDATLTVNAANGVILSGLVAGGRDSDADGDNLLVTAVRTGSEAGSGTAGTVGVSLEGAWGHLTLNDDGSYTYVADKANSLAQGATATDVFTYTVSDGKGGTDRAQLTITITGTNDLPFVATPDPVRLSEEALPGGVLDDTGNTDQSNVAVFDGNLTITDPDSSSFTISLTAPSETLTSGGVQITWSGGSNGADLVGMAGTTEVVRVSMSNSGAYKVTLSAPVDHPAAGEDTLSLNVGVTVSDGVGSTSTTLNVVIEDDAPTASQQTTNVAVSQDTNVLLVLDLSGSMDSTVTINGVSMTRLEAAVESIARLLQQYDQLGNVRVQLVTFSDTAASVYTQWQNVGTVLDYLYSLSPTAGNGGTNYDAALAAAMTAFATANKLSGAQNVSYFLTDGLPTFGSGSDTELSGTRNGTGSDQSGSDTGIQTSEETTWTNFLNTNKVNSFSFAMGGPFASQNDPDGSFTSQDYINPIAWNGATGTDANGQVVSNWNDLDAALQSTIPPVQTGNLLVGATPGAVGADGGHIYSIAIGPDGDRRTFYWNGNGTIVQDGSGSSTLVSFNTTTHVLVIRTEQGGLFTVDLDDGSYQYVPPVNMPATLTEVISFELVDNDADRSGQGQMTLILNRDSGADGQTIIGTSGADTIIGSNAAEYIHGGDGNDTINGGGGADTIIGGAGNDTMDGGAGADTFRWFFSDAGTVAAPAIDTINNFDTAAFASGGDRLDLRDLLQGSATTAGALDNYLHFQYSGGNTTIYVSATGSFSNNNNASGLPTNVNNNDVQQIVLTGVNLVGSSTTDQQVIQNLLNQGKLLTD
ncbi:T1SS-143 domain-containing protein/predicted secreted protein (type I secretion substrate), partial [Azonexus fungiphilus]